MLYIKKNTNTNTRKSTFFKVAIRIDDRNNAIFLKDMYMFRNEFSFSFFLFFFWLFLINSYSAAIIFS